MMPPSKKYCHRVGLFNSSLKSSVDQADKNMSKEEDLAIRVLDNGGGVELYSEETKQRVWKYKPQEDCLWNGPSKILEKLVVISGKIENEPVISASAVAVLDKSTGEEVGFIADTTLDCNKIWIGDHSIFSLESLFSIVCWGFHGEKKCTIKYDEVKSNPYDFDYPNTKLLGNENFLVKIGKNFISAVPLMDGNPTGGLEKVDWPYHNKGLITSSCFVENRLFVELDSSLPDCPAKVVCDFSINFRDEQTPCLKVEVSPV